MKSTDYSGLAVQFEHILVAKERITGIIRHTPADICRFLSEACNANVYLKLENRQRTGSFKLRGAANFILACERSELNNGLVAASMGNHGQAVALIGQLIKIPVTIFAPLGASPIKISSIKRLGAAVVLTGQQYEDAVKASCRFAESEKAVVVPAFEDPLVVAGQGTCGLELAAQVPDLHYLVVPVGGGGLISGIATVFAHLKPSIKLIGVQSTMADTMHQCLKRDEVFLPKALPTIADGLAGGICDMTFQIVKALVDEVIAVPEEYLAPAIGRTILEGREVVEGSAACGIAALLNGIIQPEKGSNVVVLVTGGNIDRDLLRKILKNHLK